MKIAYFHCLTADNDDVELGHAKTLGYVPETCLLGGTVVWKFVRRNLDPCASCNGPRPRCHGRARWLQDGDGLERARAMVLGEKPAGVLAKLVDPERRG